MSLSVPMKSLYHGQLVAFHQIARLVFFAVLPSKKQYPFRVLIFRVNCLSP